MNLYDALRGVARGQAVRRPSWAANIVVEMVPQDGEGRVTIRQADGSHPWTISESDLAADDWTVLTRLAAAKRVPRPLIVAPQPDPVGALEPTPEPTPTPTPEPDGV
jgi:hypothetical protein